MHTNASSIVESRNKIVSTTITFYSIMKMIAIAPASTGADDAFLPEVKEVPTDINSHRPRTTSTGTRRTTTNTRRYVHFVLGITIKMTRGFYKFIFLILV